MSLINKINDRSAKVGVIGLGYVGLPLAIEFVKAGYEVVGIDTNEDKVTNLNLGINYIKDVDNDLLKNSVENKRLTATTDFSIVNNLDTLSICAYTTEQGKNPDISYIVSVMEEVKNYLHEGMLIILESTTYPGSTNELILPYIKNDKLNVGENICLCFSPEE